MKTSRKTEGGAALAPALKDKVLTAATRLLNTRGFAALAMSELASELGVSKQSVYYHYPGAEELVLLVAKKWSESGQHYTLRALADSKEDGFFRVKAMAEGMYDWAEADPELAKVALTLYPLASEIPALDEFMSRAREAGRARLKSLLLLNPQLSKVKPSRLQEMVTELHAQMYGSFFYVIAMGQMADFKKARATCLEALEMLLRAFATET